MRSGVTLDEAQLDAALKALSSAQRRQILRVLTAHAVPGKTCCAESEVCACKLSEHLDLAPSTISHHMSVLRAAGLVTARKDGTWVYYSVQTDVLAQVSASLGSL